MPRVLVYRQSLLPISEVFVRQHHDSLSRFEPVFAGLERVDGIDISDTTAISLQKPGERSKRKTALFRLAGIAPQFMREIAQIRPDLIHAHFGVDAVDMLPVARRLGVPLLVTLHGYDVTMADREFRRMKTMGWNYLAKRKALFNKAALLLPVSMYLGEVTRGLGAPAAKIHPHYLGIPLPPATLMQPGAARRGVTFVGRLVRKKGVHRLLEALSILKQRGQSVPTTVIGDGPERQRLQDDAASLGVDVVFRGARPHAEVLSAMASAEVFCMPSAPAESGDNEGLPIVYLEAQAVGTPIVAFDQGPVGEAIANGVSGLLGPVGDVEALADNLARVIGHSDRIAEMGRAGRRRVETLFDIRRQARILEEIYESVLRTGAPPANGRSEAGP